MLKELSIEIIRRCPNNCVHCSSLSDERCSEIMEYERFVSVVKDAVNLGAKVICLSGGEPFLHSRIVDMIEFVHSLGLDSYVYTSGIIFDVQKQRAPLDNNVLRAIVGKVTKLIFNIEAGAAHTYDMVMGTRGCFEKMKQSVTMANDLSILTEAHFVPMKLNINEVEETVSLCKELNISKISFLRLVLHGRAQQNEQRIALSREEFLRLQADLEALQKKSNLDIRIGVPLSTDVSCHKCEAANGKLNIKYDGNVFPCEVFKNGRVQLRLRGLTPDCIHEHSLLDIYRNSKYLQLVRELSQEFSGGGHRETCIGQYLINNDEG